MYKPNHFSKYIFLIATVLTSGFSVSAQGADAGASSYEATLFVVIGSDGTG